MVRKESVFGVKARQIVVRRESVIEVKVEVDYGFCMLQESSHSHSGS